MFMCIILAEAYTSNNVFCNLNILPHLKSHRYIPKFKYENKNVNEKENSTNEI